jgi:hypothetical protein
MTFVEGDAVSIIPHKGKNEDGSDKIVKAHVVNPRRETDAKRLDGAPVGYYVDVIIPPAKTVLGYHAQSLETYEYPRPRLPA